MRVLIALDKLKGTLSATKACTAVADGILAISPEVEIDLCPMADGGDGSLDAIASHLGADEIWQTVSGPLGRPVPVSYLFSGDRAFVELAQASGLELLCPHERNCMHTSTEGTGQLIADAIARGAREVFVFVGGSSTNDGGMGAATALGWRFLDDTGNILDPVGCNLINVRDIVPPEVPISNHVSITVVCDVTNPFHGPEGAARVYAEQKGASASEIDQLDDGLRNLDRVFAGCGYQSVGLVSGAGAAGGIAGGLKALTGATILSGYEFISQLMQLENRIGAADIVISGEGRFDTQSLQGKVVGGIASNCRKLDKPCIIVAGMSELDARSFEDAGITRVYELARLAGSIEASMSNPIRWLRESGRLIAQTN